MAEEDKKSGQGVQSDKLAALSPERRAKRLQKMQARAAERAAMSPEERRALKTEKKKAKKEAMSPEERERMKAERKARKAAAPAG